VLARRAQAGAKDLRVEGAGQAAVAGDEQDGDALLVLVLLQDRQLGDLAARGLGGSRPRTAAGGRCAVRRDAGARRRPSPWPA
jgi:hypothetical protein